MPDRPLNIGVLLPDTENQMNGESARWSDLAAMTHTAEEVGFDSVWVTDHLIHRNDPPEESASGAIVVGGDLHPLAGPWECWSMLSAIAAITSRVEIGVLVICHAFRNPALLAKMADTVDEVSDGRLILGLGAGWNEPEFRAFGYPFDHRVDRFEEGIQIITSLLRTNQADFRGNYHQAIDCELRPRGPRPQGPPILIGTTGQRMLEMTVRYADRWNTWFSQTNNDLDQLKALLMRVDEACIAGGRDPKSLHRSSAVMSEILPHVPSEMSSPPLTGTPAQLAAQLHDYAAAGLDEVQLWIEPNNRQGLLAFGEVLRIYDQG